MIRTLRRRVRGLVCRGLGHRLEAFGCEGSIPGWLIASERCRRCGHCVAHVLPLVDA